MEKIMYSYLPKSRIEIIFFKYSISKKIFITIFLQLQLAHARHGLKVLSTEMDLVEIRINR